MTDPFAKPEDELNPTPLTEVVGDNKPIEEANPFEAKEEVVEEVKPVEIAEPIKLGVRENARQRILEEYGGLESNIPVNSSYWNR